MSQYPKHDAVVAWMKAMVGHVREAPMGSNRGGVQRTNPTGGVEYFQSFDFLPGGGYPWCVSTVQAAWAVGGKNPLPYKTAGAYDLARWAASVGWARPSRECIPGDIIVFNIGAGHVGILLEQKGDYVVTIDGNTSDQVAVRTRPRSQVRCGVHVPEKAVPLPPKLVPQPYWVIATSENGHRKLLLTRFATQAKIGKLLPPLIKKWGTNGITIKRSKTTKKLPA